MGIVTSAGEREILYGALPKKMLNNNVLIRIDDNPDDGYNLNGIVMAGGTWNEAERMPRYGVVVRVPSRFQFQEWQTEIEIEEGDTVYFGAMASANAPMLISDNLYFIIKYQDLIARLRDEVYPLNGYAVFEKVYKEEESSVLKLEHTKKQDKRLGIVRYNGRNNDSYLDKNAIDADVLVGDTVVFEGNYLTDLESKMFNKLDENLGFCQKSWINGKL